MYRILFTIIFLFVYTHYTQAQQHYTIANGLPSNELYNSFRDSKGYIWFGTDKGACRFDGKNFKVYTILDGLPDNSVLDFFEDTHGRIWLFCYNGGGCYIYNDKVHNTGNDKLLAKMPTIPYQRVMCKGDNGTQYIAYNSGPILHVDPKDSIITELECPDKIHGLSDMLYAHDTLYVYDELHAALYKYHHNKLVNSTPLPPSFGIYKGDLHCRFFENKVEIYKNLQLVAVINDKDISKLTIVKVVPFNDDAFFACTYAGIILVDYRKHTKTWLLKGMQTTSICQSISGNYWITTLDRGIYQLNREFTGTQLITNIEADQVLQKNDHVYIVRQDSIYAFDTLTLKQIPINFRYNSSLKILAELKDYIIVTLAKTMLV